MVIMTNCRMGLKAEVHFYQKSKDRRGKGKTHTQVQRSYICIYIYRERVFVRERASEKSSKKEIGFSDSAKMKRLRQIGAEMV